MTDFGISRSHDLVEVTIVVIVTPTRTVLVAGIFGMLAAATRVKVRHRYIMVEVVRLGAVPRANEQVQIAISCHNQPTSRPVTILVCDDASVVILVRLGQAVSVATELVTEPDISATTTYNLPHWSVDVGHGEKVG